MIESDSTWMVFTSSLGTSLKSSTVKAKIIIQTVKYVQCMARDLLKKQLLYTLGNILPDGSDFPLIFWGNMPPGGLHKKYVLFIKAPYTIEYRQNVYCPKRSKENHYTHFPWAILKFSIYYSYTIQLHMRYMSTNSPHLCFNALQHAYYFGHILPYYTILKTTL